MKLTKILALILALAMVLSLGAFASGEPSGDPPASGEASDASGEAKSVEEAYVDYIREWLQNELLHNDQMTQEQIDNEYMPLIEAGDYTSWPVSYLYDGWLETGTAMTFEEFAAQYQPAAGGDVTWADYQDWIISLLPDICPAPEAVAEIIRATNSWDEIDMSGPWEKIVGEEYFNCSTWPEFEASGGVGTYNADYEDLPLEDAPAASGEAS